MICLAILNSETYELWQQRFPNSEITDLLRAFRFPS